MRGKHLVSILSIVLCLSGISAFGRTAGHPSDSAREFVEQFNRTPVFYEQFDVAKKIVALGDKRVLQDLGSWLGSEDRHARGNAAFIFARLGDDRGFQVIRAILNDRSSRPMGQGVPAAPWSSQAQIAADRYYAAHLFGDLKEARAVPILVPLLHDEEVRMIVPWSLGEIGDKSAIPPLDKMLKDQDMEMRSGATLALQKLGAREAQP